MIPVVTSYKCGVCSYQVKGDIWKGDPVSEYGSKHTYASDFRIPASWKSLLSPAVPSVLTREGQHGQGHRVDDTGALASQSVALPVAMRVGATTPWLLPPELLFILSPHSRDTPIFSTQVALHIARLGFSTTTPGGHGQQQPEITSGANQGG